MLVNITFSKASFVQLEYVLQFTSNQEPKQKPALVSPTPAHGWQSEGAPWGGTAPTPERSQRTAGLTPASSVSPDTNASHTEGLISHNRRLRHQLSTSCMSGTMTQMHGEGSLKTQTRGRKACVCLSAVLSAVVAPRGGCAGLPVLVTPSAHVLHGRESARHSSVLV